MSCVFPTTPVFTTSSTSISFSGGTPTGPGFEREFTLTVPAGNVYDISVSADDSVVVSGAGISAESHWDAQKKTIVTGSATSSYVPLGEATSDASFSVIYKNKGGPFSLSAKVTSTRTDIQQARSSIFSSEQCLFEYFWLASKELVFSLINQSLEQQGIDTSLLHYPWYPTPFKNTGWDTSLTPPRIVYTCGEFSVKAGASLDLTSGEMEFGVDVYKQSETADFSVGVKIDTNGNVSAGLNIRF